MNVYQDHDACLGQLQAEQASANLVMWYNKTAIQIMPGGATYKTQNSKGGLTQLQDLSLVVRVSSFPANFNFNYMGNQTFNYPGSNGDLYSVDSVEKFAGGYEVRILANSASQDV